MLPLKLYLLNNSNLAEVHEFGVQTLLQTFQSKRNMKNISSVTSLCSLLAKTLRVNKIVMKKILKN